MALALAWAVMLTASVKEREAEGLKGGHKNTASFVYGLFWPSEIVPFGFKAM